MTLQTRTNSMSYHLSSEVIASNRNEKREWIRKLRPSTFPNTSTPTCGWRSKEASATSPPTPSTTYSSDLWNFWSHEEWPYITNWFWLATITWNDTTSSETSSRWPDSKSRIRFQLMFILSSKNCQESVTLTSMPSLTSANTWQTLSISLTSSRRLQIDSRQQCFRQLHHLTSLRTASTTTSSHQCWYLFLSTSWITSKISVARKSVLVTIFVCIAKFVDNSKSSNANKNLPRLPELRFKQDLSLMVFRSPRLWNLHQHRLTAPIFHRYQHQLLHQNTWKHVRHRHRLQELLDRLHQSHHQQQEYLRVLQQLVQPLSTLLRQKNHQVW